MAEKRICDVCNRNEASREFQVRHSLKGCWERKGSCSGFWNANKWTEWETIDICGECAETLLGLPYRDSHGHGRAPGHKE